jgi:hypothetical protein
MSVLKSYLEKVAEQKEREIHSGKILGGTGLASLGGYAYRVGHEAGKNADDIADRLHLKNPYVSRDAYKEIIEDAVKERKRVGAGALGLGGLMAGYGAYKTYQGNKK